MSINVIGNTVEVMESSFGNRAGVEKSASSDHNSCLAFGMTVRGRVAVYRDQTKVIPPFSLIGSEETY